MTICPCGSGQSSWFLYGTNGVLIKRVCFACRVKVLASHGCGVEEWRDVDEVVQHQQPLIVRVAGKPIQGSGV